MESKTRFETYAFPSHPEITVLRIEGFIDVNAVPEFERILEGLLQQKRFALLIDFADVTYISSAGVGVIIGYLQAFRDHPGGDIKLAQVPLKIMNVFQAIGLDAMVDFLERLSTPTDWLTRELKADFDHFKLTLLEPEGVRCGRPFQLRIEACLESGAPAVDYHGEPLTSASDSLVFPKEIQGFHAGCWEGPLTITGTGQVRLTIQDSGKTGALEIRVLAEDAKAEFPRSVSCGCGAQAVVKGAEIYRCQRCNSIFYVDPWAHVIPLKAGGSAPAKLLRHKGTELRINSDVNYLTSVRRFLTNLCEQEGLAETTVNETVLATEEALLNLIEHSFEFNPYCPIDLRLQFHPRKLEIRIRDRGKPFDITQRKDFSLASIIHKGKKGGTGAVLINQLMDKLVYRSYKYYNQLVMTKHLPPKPAP